MPGPRNVLDRLTIQQKLLLSAVLLAAIAGIVGLLSGRYVVRQLQDDARTHLETLADVEADRLQQQLGSMARHLRPADDTATERELLAYRRTGSSRGLDRLANAIAIARVMTPSIRSLRVYDPRGVLLAGDTIPASMAASLGRDERQLVRTIVRSGRGAYTGPVREMSTNGEIGASYLQASAVRYRNVTIGVIVGECDFSMIGRLLGNGYGNPDGSIDIHMVQRTPQGAQFITPLRFAQEAAFTRTVPWSADRSPAIRVLEENPPRSIEGVRDYRNAEVIAALRPIRGTDWGLVVKVDRAEAFAVTNRVSLVMLATFLGTFAAMLGITLVVNQSVIRRIRRITASATAMSQGDFATRVGDSQPDELGELAVAFDRMADTLARDIVRRELVESKLAHQARHDALTGLPNRWRAEERLANALGAIGDRRVAVLFCDLDDFKTVNDELGHPAGDRLLRVVAQRFRAALRPTDLLARFGGDEFLVVCTEVASQEEMEGVALRLQAALGEPVTIDRSEAYISVSIGIALSAPGSTAESMVRDADAAMYRAKELGRRRHVTHNEDIRARSAAGLTSSTDVRRAITEQRLAVVYQPIIDLSAGRLAGYESLVRWPRNGELVLPAHFIPLAQDLGLSLDLDRLVINRACEALAGLQQGGASPWMSVNVSPRSMTEPGLEEAVMHALDDHGVDPAALVLEVTEQSLELAGGGGLDPIVRLRRRGVRIAVDDFGTGHSSLARLRHLPVDILKLDRRLIEHIDDDPRTREIARAVIQLAATIGADVVAEGIEQGGQRTVLAELGCRWGQGFGIAMPRLDPEAAAREIADLRDHSTQAVSPVPARIAAPPRPS
ncbi:MAG: EAL domain-containing protein [Actinobacteria bacterium]|nr:EAL domain-containing protein [Actinomycetota bacterium]